MKEKDASFTSLQDKEQKVCGFLHCLLDAIDLNNTDLQQKATKAPKTQLDHAIQALSCVKKCQMGVSGQADGWNPKNSVIKGPFIRAKHMQAEVGSSMGVLDSKHLTNRQYNAYLDESWTLGTRPEHALTGMFMVVEATTATNCGLRAEDSRELRWPMLAFAEVIGNIRPAPCIPMQLGLRRAGNKTSHIGKAEWFAMVENALPQCCPVLAVACLLVQSQPCYQKAFVEGDDTFWEHRLLAKGTLKSEPVKYDSLHAQHSKIMANIGLADDKSGTALHIFRSTGNAMLDLEGADKSKVSSWGRWVQSTKEVCYDNKSSLHNVPVQMLLGGWGGDYKKEFFLGRSTVPLSPDVLAEFVSHLRPSLVETETKVANKLMELNALPQKEKQWQCNQKIRTYLADMHKSVQAERRLIQVFLYGLPLLVAQYTAERLVVVRGSKKVQQLLQDARYNEYSAHVKHGHRNALERIELARLPLEERMEAQQQRLAMQQAKTLSQATTAMPAGSRAQFVTSHTCAADESGSKNQQAPIANLPESALVEAKSGVLHFADLTTVEDAFNVWQKIHSQVDGCGGWKELSKQSRNNYNKRRHLVQRISMLMEHGLSASSACRVYAHIQQQGGFSLAELRDAVNFAEPVPNSRAKGGRPASRKDTDIMPRDNSKTLVTKGQILLWHAKALQAELSQARDKAALKL
ncbi:hypothetical protein ABBQ32_012538 [Trebouxia sp. C0010 RCD-2024]